VILMMKTQALWFKPLSFIRKSRFSNRLFYAYVTAGGVGLLRFVLHVT
jgi:hypothetical protein